MTVQSSSAKSSAYLEAVKHRRTVYGVTDNISVSDDRIVEIVNETIQTMPSAFNMQNVRILVTLGKEHKKFWNAVITAAKPLMLKEKGEEDWKRNEDRFKSFQAAYGTISLFDDHAPIERMHEKFPGSPTAVFEEFADQSNAMHQITLWTALELEGLGASLQHSHYVPGAEAGIKAAFDIPSAWAPKAQIVFGGLPGEMPPAPEKEPVSTTVKVFK